MALGRLGASGASLRPLLKQEEMQSISGVTGDDHLVAGDSAAQRGRIAVECSHRPAGLQVPHLQRLVPRNGNRPLRVRRHCHARNSNGGYDSVRIVNCRDGSLQPRVAPDQPVLFQPVAQPVLSCGLHGHPCRWQPHHNATSDWQPDLKGSATVEESGKPHAFFLVYS